MSEETGLNECQAYILFHALNRGKVVVDEWTARDEVEAFAECVSAGLLTHKPGAVSTCWIGTLTEAGREALAKADLPLPPLRDKAEQ